MKTSIRTGSGTFTINRGSEGPQHDPYSFTETDFDSNSGDKINIRTGGLGYTRLKVNDREWEASEKFDEETLRLRFRALTGALPEDVERFIARKSSRCPCGCRKTETQAGYPGETFEVCAKCGEIVGSYFDEAAII